MAKLSLEAWTLAFYQVMKETPPVSPKIIKNASASLGRQQAETGKAIRQAEDKAKHAGHVAEDAESKRYAAGVERDEIFQKTLTVEGRASAQRDYEAAVRRAEEASQAFKEAKSAVKVLKFQSEGLAQQIQDLEERKKSGDFEGLQGELEKVMTQARLEQRLELENQKVGDAEEKVANLKNLLHEATARHDVREAESLKGDLASRQEILEAYLLQREAVLALMPGYEIAPVAPNQHGKLEEQAKSLQGASKVAQETAQAQQVEVGTRKEGVAHAQALLEEAAANDPALKDAQSALVQARKALGERESELLQVEEEVQGLGEVYARHQALVDRYAAGAKDAPGGEEIDASLDVLEKYTVPIADARGRLRGRQDALRNAGIDVGKRLAALADAIDERLRTSGADPALVQAQKALDEADAELRRAAQALREADAQALALAGQADEAARRLQVVQTLPKATTAAQELTEALKGVEDVPIWEGSKALLEKLGKANYDRLYTLSQKLINDFQKLVDNGATMEELQAVYKGVPELWLPPRFREEEKNWVAMRGLLDEETMDGFRKETSTRLAAVDEKIELFKSKLESGEGLFGKIKEGVEYGEKGPEIVKHIAEKLKSTKELSEKFEQALSLAGKLATVLGAPLKAIETGGKAMETEDPVEALMLQDEFMASLGDLLGGLTGSAKDMKAMDIGGVVVKQISALLPGIGVAVSFGEVMKGMVDSAARIEESVRDAESHEQAVEGKHRGEAAIAQFARRDKHLAARAATKTGVAMVKAAAGVVDLTGVGVVASTAMKGVATGVGAVQGVGEQIVDRGEGEQARALLERAQAGDGGARSELFRFHPRYAKGILAIMASEGDALALQVLSTHGLDESMIRRSSPKIVKRYLMKKFGESDVPPSWSSARDAAAEKLRTVAGLFERIDGFFGNVADKLLKTFDGNDLVRAQASLSDLAYQLDTQADVGTAASAFVDVRMRRDALAEKATDGQAQELEVLDGALADERKKIAKLRAAVLASLGNVRTVLADILKQPAGGLRDKAEGAARQVLREHLQRVDRLAALG
ncbi:hypothetical protein [Pseudorhodoferax sp. Leaf274]|uniref:hypothetical protein n=1 Tax=Pseudorhodoferax sp. Leaf274 TaxID=1736318 RepID=UPI00070339C5|nr:hypothetical protein [Pseudorhodoferax sp. Leaf274]KQP38985.1 hypothetical protein ASF44_11200 [Pseudorhodoferax sp. Leaf274]